MTVGPEMASTPRTPGGIGESELGSTTASEAPTGMPTLPEQYETIKRVI